MKVGHKRWPKSCSLQELLPCGPAGQDLVRMPGLSEAPRPRTAARPSQRRITVTERRPEAPGFSHLLFQDFLRDSVRKVRYHLLLLLFPRQARARLGGSFPVHLLISYPPQSRSSGSYFPRRTTFPECPFTQRHPIGSIKVGRRNPHLTYQWQAQILRPSHWRLVQWCSAWQATAGLLPAARGAERISGVRTPPLAR